MRFICPKCFGFFAAPLFSPAFLLKYSVISSNINMLTDYGGSMKPFLFLKSRILGLGQTNWADKSLKFEFWSWEISKDFERLKSCHIKGSEMSLEAQIRLHFAILAFRATSSCYLRWVEPSKISQIQIQVRENNKVHLFEEMHQYSCNKITTTWIQIFRQNWNVFFSNASHWIMI